MKNSFFHYLLLLTLLFIGSSIFAQSTDIQKVNLRLLARNQGDAVVLRWAYANENAWRYLNTQGFILERLVLDDKTNKADERKFEALNAEPIRPWPQERWIREVTATKDTFAIIAGGCLTGESTVATTEDNFFKQLDQKAKEEAGRFGFAMFSADLSPLAATGLGLMYVDKNIEPHKKYIYRLRVQDDPKDRFRTDTAIFIVKTDVIGTVGNAPKPDIDPADGELSLKWIGEGFTAWWIERADSENGPWKRLNQRPYLNIHRAKPDADEVNTIVYPDLKLITGKKYYYRTIGLDAFGAETTPSPVALGIPVDLTPPPPPVVTRAENTTGTTIELAWDEAKGIPDLTGFIIGKAINIEGPYEPMTDNQLPVSTHTFTDRNADVYGRNFYRVFAVDTAGNRAGSTPAYVIMKNDGPPAPPVGLKGDIAKDGIVTLHWPVGKEKDLLGYEVFVANQIDHPFIPLSTDVVRDTMFRDSISLKNLTEHIYYRIKAVDQHMVVSEFSAILELKKPDIVPPSEPVMKDYIVTDSTVWINWVNSSSKDAAKHVLYRSEDEGDWTEIKTFGMETSTYLDRDVKRNHRYDYTLKCIDDDGLESEKAFPIKVKVMDSGIRAEVKDFTTRWSAENKTVELRWVYPTNGESIRYVIFRSVNKGPLETLTMIDNGQTTFTDKKVAPGMEYEYAIRAIHRAGGASPLTGKVGVSTK